MGIGMKAAMRSGLVSGKAAAKFSNATLRQTTSQRGQMTEFDGRSKDEGKVVNRGHVAPVHQIDDRLTQRDRARSMPSKGGAVNASYVPGKRAIDQFPEGQRKVFPKGSGTDGRGHSAKTGNTRMKDGKPMKSGGPSGGNANSKSYYGGPRGRDGT